MNSGTLMQPAFPVVVHRAPLGWPLPGQLANLTCAQCFVLWIYRHCVTLPQHEPSVGPSVFDVTFTKREGGLISVRTITKTGLLNERICV